jgi:hypothetical protein
VQFGGVHELAETREEILTLCPGIAETATELATFAGIVTFADDGDLFFARHDEEEIALL